MMEMQPTSSIVSVSNTTAIEVEGRNYLRCDFKSRTLGKELRHHMDSHGHPLELAAVYMDYVLMSSTLEKFAGRDWSLLKFLVTIGNAIEPEVRLIVGGSVYLPTPNGLYASMVRNDLWRDVEEAFQIIEIRKSDVLCNPLVACDIEHMQAILEYAEIDIMEEIDALEGGRGGSTKQNPVIFLELRRRNRLKMKKQVEVSTCPYIVH